MREYNEHRLRSDGAKRVSIRADVCLRRQDEEGRERFYTYTFYAVRPDSHEEVKIVTVLVVIAL
jgi:hypothetical protein